MANVLLNETRRAGGVIRQYRGVVLTADDTVAEVSVLGTGPFFGIAQELADANDVTVGKRVIAIMTHGVSKAVAGQVLEVDLRQIGSGDWHYEVLVLTRDRRYQIVVVDAPELLEQEFRLAAGVDEHQRSLVPPDQPVDFADGVVRGMPGPRQPLGGIENSHENMH